MYFKLFSNCIPVKGHKRSIIYDLQRNRYDFIPNSLYDILKKYHNNSLKEIYTFYGQEDKEVLDEYFEFLVSKEYIFWCFSKEELKYFPDLNLSFETPSIITNCIIDVNNSSKHNYRYIIAELEELGCKHVQFRFFEAVPNAYIHDLLKFFDNTRIKSIELLVQNAPELSIAEIKKICINYLRITLFIISNSNENNVVLAGVNRITKIIYTKENINDCTSCGLINYDFFSVNIPFYSESINYNSCLNRKISIDTDGEIKNCPSMSKSYGNIKNMTLKDALKNSDFKQYWNITKDQIKICMDCEFRYMCTDCRVFLENPNDIFSKPLKCGYDPYTATWN